MADKIKPNNRGVWYSGTMIKADTFRNKMIDDMVNT